MLCGFKEVDVVNLATTDTEIIFKEVISGDVPILIRGADIGSCSEKWSPEYLISHLQQPASIHVSSSTVLSFLDKNFKYQTMNLSEMISKSVEDTNQKYYLRSVGKNVRVDPSDFIQDYPSISKDFKIPEFLTQNTEINIHSSILRISSPNLTLWTHFDVYDNILVQVKGRKSVILFPPSDVKNLYVVGDKSRIPHFNQPIESIAEEYPLAKTLNGYAAILEENDILFIPNYWWHSVTSLTFSVGVNIFWANAELLPLYDKKDVYGNKDPIPAAMARSSLEKCIKNLQELPENTASFMQHYS